MYFIKRFPAIWGFAVCGSGLEGCNGVQMSEGTVLKVCPFYCWILVLEKNFLEVFLVLWEERKGNLMFLCSRQGGGCNSPNNSLSCRTSTLQALVSSLLPNKQKQ